MIALVPTEQDVLSSVPSALPPSLSDRVATAFVQRVKGVIVAGIRMADGREARVLADPSAGVTMAEALHRCADALRVPQ